ncbi:hypothetical protein LQW54_008737 [Pestalotiopsis sp. IQ-011]
MAEADQLHRLTNRDKIGGPDAQKKSFPARCHCSRVRFSITLAAAALPLRGYLCHCGACRRSHGSPAGFYVILPPGVAPEWEEESSRDVLARWEGEAGRETLFCPTCGSHVGGYRPGLGQWAVTWGVFEDKFWELSFHACAESGGMADWLPAVPHLSLGAGVSPENDVASSWELSGQGSDRTDESRLLRAECACGGVSFSITRPTRAIIDDAYMGRYVHTDDDNDDSQANKNKWKAFLDMCRDCGRATGATAVAWALIPRIAIADPPLPPDLQGFGSMRTHRSSERVTRGFCGRCGATVLLSTTRREPTREQAVLDIAVGILRVDDVRLEDWVVWRTGNVAWADDARGFDAEFTDALVTGFWEWGVKTQGQALDFAVF